MIRGQITTVAKMLTAQCTTFLPPCRGKVRMGVEQWEHQDSTPTPSLPLLRGGSSTSRVIHLLLGVLVVQPGFSE